MARDTRAAFLRALEKHDSAVARAFLEAIYDIQGSASFSQLEAILFRAQETGNIARAKEEIIEALGLGREFFAPLDRALSEAFIGGADYQTGLVPQRPVPGLGRVVFRFDGRLPRAEDWMRNRAAALITEVTEDERLGLRQALDQMFRENLTPRRMVTTLVGEMSGNQRKGGLIGLHSKEKAAVLAAKAELRAGNYGAYKKRLKHVGRQTIAAAQKAGRALTETEVQRIGGNYADALLRARARRIGRTESNKAMVAGRVEAIYQMIEDGKVEADLVTLRWEATPGPRTRDSHRALDGQEVPIGQVFVSPTTGALLRWPHDENAPPEEVINCRCSVTVRIAWEKMAA